MSRTDTARRLIAASPDRIYAALTDADAVVAWLPPEGMTGRIIAFEPQVGGRFALALSYRDPADHGIGKTDADTDVTEGRFVALEPGRRVVQSARFDSDDPAFAGTMTMTWLLEPHGTSTQVIVTATDVPPGITAEDHEAGIASSLANLARVVEGKAS